MIRMIGNFRIGLGWSGERALDIDLEDFDQGGATKRKDGLPPVHPGEIIKQDILPHGPPQNFGPPRIDFRSQRCPVEEHRDRWWKWIPTVSAILPRTFEHSGATIFENPERTCSIRP